MGNIIPWVKTHGYNHASLRDEIPLFAYHLDINYIRDKRSPTPKSEAVSRIMSANRPKNTKPELTLRKALYHAGIRGYRIYRIALSSSHSDA